MRKEVLYKHLPETPGVYLMKNAMGKVLYVGKAGNLKRRVSSYFQKDHELRTERLLAEVASISYRKTDTAIEALILEAELIKKLEPPYNVREKDDKSFLYVEITKDEFPRVLLVRGRSKTEGIRFGPFTSASSIREALRIIRRIFPYNTHAPDKVINKASLPADLSAIARASAEAQMERRRACFDHEIGLCPGTCIGAISRTEYARTIRRIKLFFAGKKQKILAELEKDMRKASDALEFEKAEKIRRQLFALRHIQDVAFITEDSPPLYPRLRPTATDGQAKRYTLNATHRIEGYDISNISGTSAVGAMAVFTDGVPDRNEYRKFRIRTVRKPNDVGMLKEILERRFKNSWRLPNLIVIDGGAGQVNVARRVVAGRDMKIPVVGIAKGPERKRNDIYGAIPRWTKLGTLVKVRDEAHRFAIAYHKKVRGKSFLE